MCLVVGSGGGGIGGGSSPLSVCLVVGSGGGCFLAASFTTGGPLLLGPRFKALEDWVALGSGSGRGGSFGLVSPVFVSCGGRAFLGGLVGSVFVSCGEALFGIPLKLGDGGLMSKGFGFGG